MFFNHRLNTRLLSPIIIETAYRIFSNTTTQEQCLEDIGNDGMAVSLKINLFAILYEKMYGFWILNSSTFLYYCCSVLGDC